MDQRWRSHRYQYCIDRTALTSCTIVLCALVSSFPSKSFPMSAPPSGSPSTSASTGQVGAAPTAAAAASSSSPAASSGGAAPVTGKYSKRKRFEHGGRVIYEWEQNIEQLDMWITPPPGVTAKMIDCKIDDRHFRIGIKGNPPFIDEDLFAQCIVDESLWMMEDGVLHINFQKAVLGDTWPSLLRGHAQLSAAEQEQETQQIMLERFGREHPGFDFSQAKFTGQTPDPKSFLGGIDTHKIKGKS